MAVEAYNVNIPETALTELRQRLSLTDLPDELDEAGWDMGAPLADIRRLIAVWKDDFDWRKSEAEINELPNYRTVIQAEGFEPLSIHFVHQTSPVPGAIPLLFCHGWPGSFLEVRKLLPLLAAGDGTSTVAFHVVAPSLPNFGFSEGTKKKGFGLKQYAETCHKLMLKLGYQQYITQGGDWGFHITRTIGLLYPTHCVASHLNVTECYPPSLLSNPLLFLKHALTPYTAYERAGLARTASHTAHGMGYDITQRTKPQTLSCALTSSPAGLLAWLYEKLHEWTDAYPWTDAEIVTWVSLYWFSTAGVAANLRIYYESWHNMDMRSDSVHYDRALHHIPGVKLGIAHFPRDLSVLPNSWAATLGEVVLQRRHGHGGHFAAVEHPEVIVEDLVVMMGKGGGAYGSVGGRDGYK